jgi:Mn-dependent DtxR family transcriptional regulator
MMELLTFINLCNGATLTQIQSHMLTTFGLKFKTTSEMLRELTMAGALKVDGHGIYHLTDKQQAAFKRMVVQEQKENTLKPILKQIENIKDKKTRNKALKLLQRLLETLPSEESADQ